MPPKINFTEDEEKEIVNLYIKERLSKKSIGEKFNCSRIPINRVLRTHNIKTIIGYEFDEDKIIRLYTKEKKTTRQIGKMFGYSRVPILCILKKRGIETKPNISGKDLMERYGEERARKIIMKIKKRRAKQIIPIKDTTIEVKIQNFLKQLGIEFYTHQYIKEIEHGYQCDILIPSMNLVIECDGDYWHKYPIGTEIDNIRTSELIEKGFRVLRLWENEIRVMELNDLKEKLKYV